MKRLLGIIVAISASLVLASCSLGKKPDYLIMAARDNGFMPAYRAYFAVDGDSIRKISSFRYDDLILGKSDYKMFNETYYTFDVTAETGDPAEWEYVPNPYIEDHYDEDLLVEQLKEIGVSYTGDIYIVITEFDDYTVFQVTRLENRALGENTYAMFRDGRKLDLPKNIKLDSLDCFYRRVT